MVEFEELSPATDRLALLELFLTFQTSSEIDIDFKEL